MSFYSPIGPVVHAYASTLGSDVFRLESAATSDDPLLAVRQGRVTTTDATVTTLTGCTLTTVADNAYGVRCRVTARRTGGTAGTANDAAYYDFSCLVVNRGGAAVIVKNIFTTVTVEDQVGWNATFDASGNDVRVRVTGAANNDVTWHGTLEYTRMST